MRFLIAIFVSANLFAADIAPFVPRPTWGIDEPIPDRPADWSSPVAGHYFIKSTGTDTANTYGTPTAPRLTIPSSLPAGSRVEISGTYSAGSIATFVARGNSSTWSANSAGPVWVTSDPTNLGIFLEGVAINNSTNLYFDGISISNLVNNSWEITGTGNAKYIMIRNSILNGLNQDHGGIVARGGDDGLSGIHQNILIYSNFVHQMGDVTVTEDQDRMGIQIGQYTSYGWALSNIVSLTSGPGIRLGSSDTADPNSSAGSFNHYAHANTVWSNLQCNLWIKYGSNIVFSQNTVHHALPHPVTPGTLGMSFGGQYEPHNVIWINNFAYSNSMGFQTESFDANVPKTNYVVGNVFYKIGLEHDSTWTPSASGEPTGIMLNNAVDSYTYIFNNTIHDSISGIHHSQSGSAGVFYYYNSIVSELSRTDSWHFRNDVTTSVNAFTNLFYDSVTAPRINHGGNTYTVAQWIANTSIGDGTLTTDPLFDDPTSNDFGIDATSPAKDSGVDITVGIDHDWVARLNAIHGTSTTIQDLNGVSRPQNSLWDIGATEFSTALPAAITATGITLNGVTFQ